METDSAAPTLVSQIGDQLGRIFRHMLPGLTVLLAAAASHPSWLKPVYFASSWHLTIFAAIAVLVGNTWYVFHRYSWHQLCDYGIYFWKKRGEGVLCSAKFESYLELLIADWGRAIASNALITDRMPLHTRAFLMNHPSVESAYRRYILDNSEAHLLPQLGALLGEGHFAFAAKGQTAPQFQVQRIYKDVKYPSPKNLKRLFNRCGVINVFNELNRIGKRNVEALLRSFNDIRTEMAHEGMPIGLAATDIKSRINNMESVVRYIDRMFHSHTCKSTGADCWTT